MRHLVNCANGTKLRKTSHIGTQKRSLVLPYTEKNTMFQLTKLNPDNLFTDNSVTKKRWYLIKQRNLLSSIYILKRGSWFSWGERHYLVIQWWVLVYGNTVRWLSILLSQQNSKVCLSCVKQDYSNVKACFIFPLKKTLLTI